MRKAAIVKLLVVACAVATCLMLGACGSSTEVKSDPVAATVNGAEIKESAVTEQVEGLRQQLVLTEDEAWGQWLGANAYTPQIVRQTVIDALVSNELLKQGAAEKGVDVSDDDVASYFEEIKSSYDSDDLWNQELESSGMSEDQYRESIKASLLRDAVTATFDPAGEDEQSQLERSQAFDQWLGDLESSADVKVSDMPDGLSYAIDMTQYSKAAE